MTSQRIVTAIIAALVVWGVFLAIGATGYFIESSLFDVRKSLIVLACMAAFLGLWTMVLRSIENKPQQSRWAAPADGSDSPSSEAHESQRPTMSQSQSDWSKAGLCSIAMVVLGVLLWVVAVLSFGHVSKTVTTVLGWSVAGLVIGAATSGMIALANPRQLKGKWFGLCGLLQSIVAFVVFFQRMTPG